MVTHFDRIGHIGMYVVTTFACKRCVIYWHGNGQTKKRCRFAVFADTVYYTRVLINMVLLMQKMYARLSTPAQMQTRGLSETHSPTRDVFCGAEGGGGCV